MITLTGATGVVTIAGPLNSTLTTVQSLTVTTNSNQGYYLQIEMNDGSTNLFNALDTGKSCSGGFYCVASTANGLASTDGSLAGLVPGNAKGLAGDTWGYNFSGSSNSPASGFFTVPERNKPQIINSANGAVADHPTYVTFGARPTGNFPSGVYQNSVLYTAVTVEAPVVVGFASTVLQDVTATECDAAAVGQIGFMTDSRNGQTYRARKMEDGSCWMIDNLKLELTPGMVLSASNTNVPSDRTVYFTKDGTASGAALPGMTGNFTTSGYLTRDGYYGSNATSADAWRQVDAGIDSKCQDANSGAYNTASPSGCGYLYNYYTATAGMGTAAVTSGNAAGDICPKGWRLPRGTSTLWSADNEMDQLNAKMAGFASNQEAGYQSDGLIEYGWLYYSTDKYWKFWSPTGPWQGSLAGVYFSSLQFAGEVGYYWTSSTSSADVAFNYAIYFDSPSQFIQGDNVRIMGNLVRCVLK
jgi:uncharacterized protein (TIGR02145 family)